tara:strand:- start:13 stop:357 length:345 start_codon:yes stop_codon:yes gene_type:complete
MKWFLIFLSVPLIEIFVLLKINEFIGLIYTLSTIIATALIGTIFVKSQAREVFTTLNKQAKNPLLLMSHGVILVIAGILLLTPGFITDIVGFFLLIPSFRTYILQILSKKFIRT